MKYLSQFSLILFLVSLAYNVRSQDTLSAEQLQPLTHPFNIVNGELTGDGASFLKNEMAKAQFTMIGEFHGSARISQFTEAVIPVLDAQGCKTFVLEVGPITGQILDGLGENIRAELKDINEKYMMVNEDYVDIPIPFFDHVEDAAFLQQAKSKGWDVVGIDQEYLSGYQQLIDKMYENLSVDQQAVHKELHQATSDSLSVFYEEFEDDKSDLFRNIKKSPLFKKYLSEMSAEPQNIEIVEALLASNEIYLMNSNRQWYGNNSTRAKYMKRQLREQLAGNDFDLSADKLLIKTGAYHVSRGLSPMAVYDVGNTLSEIAEFNGNSSLNITFTNRFYFEDGVLQDASLSKKKWEMRTKDLAQMGRKEEWVVIDLRPLIKGHHYYPIKYKPNKYVINLAERFDLLVIPATEGQPTPNYDK